jgi:uncharacterized protein (DUF302 family)
MLSKERHQTATGPKGAASVGEELRPTQMLMFGNPRLGAPLMMTQQSMGLDLPLRVVSFEDADGKVHVVYHTPTALADAHGIPADRPALQKITGALDILTKGARHAHLRLNFF